MANCEEVRALEKKGTVWWLKGFTLNAGMEY